MTDDEHGFIFDGLILKHFESDIVRSKRHLFVRTHAYLPRKIAELQYILFTHCVQSMLQWCWVKAIVIL